MKKVIHKLFFAWDFESEEKWPTHAESEQYILFLLYQANTLNVCLHNYRILIRVNMYFA